MSTSFTLRCRDGMGHLGNHDADGILYEPDGRKIGHMCQAHAAEVIDEYREKLGEVWTFVAYDIEVTSAPQARLDRNELAEATKAAGCMHRVRLIAETYDQAKRVADCLPSASVGLLATCSAWLVWQAASYRQTDGLQRRRK